MRRLSLESGLYRIAIKAKRRQVSRLQGFAGAPAIAR